MGQVQQLDQVDPITAFHGVYARTANLFCWGYAGMTLLMIWTDPLVRLAPAWRWGLYGAFLLGGYVFRYRLTYHLARYLCTPWYQPQGRAGTYRGFRYGVGTPWDTSDY